MKQRLLKQRRLPSQGRFLVEPGQRVAHDAIVGELDYIPGPLTRVNAAVHLGIDPAQLDRVMVKGINEKVAAGDELAVVSQFYTRCVLKSPVDGYLALWSRYLGYVYVREPLPVGPRQPLRLSAEELGLSKLQFAAEVCVKENTVVARGQLVVGGKQKVLAPSVCRVSYLSVTEGVLVLTPLFQATQLPALIDGFVEEIVAPDLCRIESYGHRFAGAIGYGGEGTGILMPLLGEERDLQPSDLRGELSGCIVAARGGASLDALRMLAELKISGLVLGCIDLSILAAFSRQEPLKSLGALMDLPFPIVIVQGFGSPMLAETWREIAALQGYRATVDASTQLRAGVTRPELLVVLPEEIEKARQASPPSEAQTSLQPGDEVVLIRQPHFGKRAEVLRLEAGLRRTDAGTWAALVELRLTTGEQLWLPLNNCQLLPMESGGESRER